MIQVLYIAVPSIHRTSANLHICTSAHLHICPCRWLSHDICTSAHLSMQVVVCHDIYTSAHLHICPCRWLEPWYLHICTSVHAGGCLPWQEWEHALGGRTQQVFGGVCLGLASTVYIHRIWPYIWWFLCQNYRIYTVYIYIWFWPTLCVLQVTSGAWELWYDSCKKNTSGSCSDGHDRPVVRVRYGPYFCIRRRIYESWRPYISVWRYKCYRLDGKIRYGVRYGAKLALPVQFWPLNGLSAPTPPISTFGILLSCVDATQCFPGRPWGWDPACTRTHAYRKREKDRGFPYSDSAARALSLFHILLVWVFVVSWVSYSFVIIPPKK